MTPVAIAATANPPCAPKVPTAQPAAAAAPAEPAALAEFSQAKAWVSTARGTAASASTEQRTRIRDTVLKEKDAPRVGRVDFSVREGTVIPRTVHVVEVPRVIIDIHPEWRGYKYFIVNDEIVIVEPSTLRIVAVIPA